MDYQATQSLPAIRSAIVNGDLPWDNEEVFDQWVSDIRDRISEAIHTGIFTYSQTHELVGDDALLADTLADQIIDALNA